MTKARQWTIFTIVAVLVVLLAGWMVLIKPEKSKVSDLKSQAAGQEQANQLLLTQITSLQGEQKQLPQQQLALAKFATEVPDNEAEPTLIRQLTTAANGAGVDLISMTPAAPGLVAAPVSATPTTTGTASTTPPVGATTTTGLPVTGAPLLYQLPVALAVTGSYPNMVSFFQAVEKLPRAMVVAGWSMCPLTANGGGASGGTGGASCQAPTPPTNKTPPPGTLGGTLNATVFYSPPVAVAPTTTVGGTATSTVPTTAPTTASAPTSGASTAPAS